MKNKRYIIDTKFEEKYDATSKARKDIENILNKENYLSKYIIIPKASNYKELFKNIKLTYNSLIKILEEVENNSTLVFQYPWDSFSYKFSKAILKYKKKKNLKTIVIIHDLNSLRSLSFFGRIYYKYYVREFKYLSLFDYIICHNNKMKKLLITNKVNSNKIVELSLFDYLTNYNNINDIKNFKFVSVAGNLTKEKSKYLYELCELKQSIYNIELFGTNYNGRVSSNINYRGAFPPDELVSKINFGFGLVWDGESIDSLEGNFGKYELYNNPHKLSLYLACNIPVIVSKDAAIASFVKKHNIGYAVKSLKDIEKVLKKCNKTQYKKMLKNVNEISIKVKDGYFIKQAINKCK